MVVISYGTLRDFFEKHADAKDALNNWYRLVSQADWANFHEIKTMYNTVDAVSNDRFVFNIRGNHYRVVAMIFLISERFISGSWERTRNITRSIARRFKKNVYHEPTVDNGCRTFIDLLIKGTYEGDKKRG